MNWKLTLIKGAVVGVLAALGVWGAEIQGVQSLEGVPPWWVALAMVVIETVRDAIKTRFGTFEVK